MKLLFVFELVIVLSVVAAKLCEWALVTFGFASCAVVSTKEDEAMMSNRHILVGDNGR